MQGDARVVGRYHLVERLAVGGMAEIFLACERGAHGFERLVVIKKMLPSLAEDSSFVDMFLQEARTQAQVNHPNVVHIHELGDAEGQPYMVMEYVAGSTLRQLLQAVIAADAQVPMGVALDLAIQACAGAHAIHELQDTQGNPLGLVHRDLTPHNLMVTDEGFLKILDFGIVKQTHDDEARTRTGVLKGKIAYMSPEQCLQEALDRRSDVYTLGNCAWELLAREKLYRAANEVGVMQAIISGAARDVREVRPEVPAAVADAISQALAPSRESRYATADEMRRSLVDAAQRAGVAIDRDETQEFVRRWLGDKHAVRKKAVEDALEKTLVTFSAARMPDPASLTGVTSATRVGLLGLFGALALGLVGGAFALGALAAVVALLFDPTGRTRREEVDDYAPPVGEPLSMLLAPVVDGEVLLSEWEPLRRYLETAMGRPLTLEVPADYAETSRGLLAGEADFAVLPPYIFLKTLDVDPVHVEPMGTKIYDGSRGFEGMLLVGEGSTATRLEEMKGGTICYSDVDSTTSYILPRLAIREAGLDPDADFTPHISGNHAQVLRDLVAGTCDVGGTYTGNYAGATSTGIPVARLRILAITGRSPHDAVVAGPAADLGERDALRGALLAFDPRIHLGRARLGDVEQITGFDPADLDEFARLRDALRLESETAPHDGPR